MGTSANGHAVQYSTSGPSAGDLVEFAGEAEDLYDTATAALVASGTASPTDSQIYTEMMDRLQPVSEYSSDFTLLRSTR